MRTLSLLTKGLPLQPRQWEISSAEVAARNLNLLDSDVPLPAAVLKESALAHNSRWMRAFLAQHDVAIAPHGKTTMSPALFHRQIEDGAWGITAANVHQAAVMQASGIRRVLIANQVVDSVSMRWCFDVLRDDETFELFVLVDSLDGVGRLDAIAREVDAGRALALLVELGAQGGRTGCRTVDYAVEVARAVSACTPRLALAGIEGYEGAIPGDDAAAKEDAIREFITAMTDLAQRCVREGLFTADPVLLTAGGSAFFDLCTALPRELASRRTQVMLRSGCYLTFDEGYYGRRWDRLVQRSPSVAALGEPLRPAIEIWSSVQSVPEQGLAILTMGKRDVAHDIDLPFPRWRAAERSRHIDAAPPSWRIEALNDQHAFLRCTPNAMPRVGERVGCAISHPCTTFDKWRTILIVDDDYRVVDAVSTWF
ncbi:MAG TPA: amino acid deaminase [Casimicrobiaceae bacterium]|nr:amino acid deaminase [Casimicrobiaceae bacterium]